MLRIHQRRLGHGDGCLGHESCSNRGIMKAILLLVSLVAACTVLAVDEENLATLKVGSEVYSKVTVTSVTATHIYFTHSLGMGSVKLKDLEPDMQEHFHFDAAKAAAIESQQEQANALY